MDMQESNSAECLMTPFSYVRQTAVLTLREQCCITKQTSGGVCPLLAAELVWLVMAIMAQSGSTPGYAYSQYLLIA